MRYQNIKRFFMWNSIVNICILTFYCLIIIGAKNYLYAMHSKLFSLDKESFAQLVYLFLGLYKIIIVVFNLIPFLVLALFSRTLTSNEL